ncbi:MAG: hypothetical protein WCV90_07875 [Candidatus Woesearchaeota archaeon]|jgi:hypothetical protein
MNIKNLGIAALLFASVACSAGMRDNPCADGTFSQGRCKDSMNYRGNPYVRGGEYVLAPVRARSLAEKTFDEPYVSTGISTGKQWVCLSLYGSNQGYDVETTTFKRLVGEYLTAVTPGADETEIGRSVYHGLDPLWQNVDEARGESTVHGCLNLGAPLLSKRVVDGIREDVMYK